MVGVDGFVYFRVRPLESVLEGLIVELSRNAFVVSWIQTNEISLHTSQIQSGGHFAKKYSSFDDVSRIKYMGSKV